MQCPRCSTENDPEAKACTGCGFILVTTSNLGGIDEVDLDEPTNPEIRVEELVESETMQVDTDSVVQSMHGSCPFCKQALPGVGAFCPHCGQSLAVSRRVRYCKSCNTRLVMDANYCHHCGTVAPSLTPILVLNLESPEPEEPVILRLEDVDQEWFVGRTIEQLNQYVEIDLTPYGGKSRGVSRRHAKIHFDKETGNWLAEDLASQFGTFVNDQKLENSYALVDGVKIRFGGLIFGVTIED